MADKRLRTMVFPGLEDTYTIPQDMNDLESIDAVADPYDEFTAYAIGDYCSNGGKLYRCNTAIPSGETWNANHWTETNVGDELLAEKAATETALSGKVSKAGDTMTGALSIQRDNVVAPSIVLRDTNDIDTTPSSAVNSNNIYWRDGNGKQYGLIRSRHLTNGRYGIWIAATRKDGNVANGIELYYDQSGNPIVTVASPAAWREALGVAPYTKGTWTPKLYDYNTFIQDLPVQDYYKIGDFYVCSVYLTSFPETTFATMIQIRNLPCRNCLGGSGIYAANVSPGKGGDWTIQGGSGYAAYLRPNYVGTISGGIFSVTIFGTD